MNDEQPTLHFDHGQIRTTPMPKKIGAYHILGILGQGGMGTVYLAEQKEPVGRKVALKVVRTGMHNDMILARFQLERNALARMNHPHIAAVYDAGTTEDGFPFFVMEHAEGSSVIAHCDGADLPLEDRLVLFIQICEAVAHAHRRMVIHRDLKPSNILVTLRDGKAVPKIIDFGVARFMGPDRDEAGLTSVGMPVGTPAYLAPEQIEGNPEDIDARVDVYSLGVVLYELLCGVRPFEDTGNVHQVFMRILNQDPPTPSTRLARAEAEAKQAARHRSIEEKLLRRKLKGDLDWIVMKAMARDRDKRYAGVTQLAEDLERYRQNHPVLAKPPTARDRVGKFVRRHRVAVASGIAVVLVLLLGIIGTTVGMLRAEAARRKAVAAEQTARITVDYLRDILSSADPSQDGRQVKVVDLLDRASQMISHDMDGRPEVEAPLRKTLGWTYLELGLYDRAQPQLEQALALQSAVLGSDHLETLSTRNALGRLHYKRGRYAEAEAIHRDVYNREVALQGQDHPTTMWSLYNLAKAVDKQGKWEEAERLYRLNVTLRTRVLGPEHPHTLISKNSLGLLLSVMGKNGEAQTLLQTNLNALRKTAGDDHPNTLNAMANLVSVYNRGGRYAEALALADEVVAGQTRIYGEAHPETLESRAQRAYAMLRLGRCDEAVVIDQDLLRARRETLGPEHGLTRATLLELGMALCCRGDHQLSLPLFEEAFRQKGSGQLGSVRQEAHYLASFGACLLHVQRPKTALMYLQQAQDLLGSQASEDAFLVRHLGDAYAALGNEERADVYRAQLQRLEGSP